MTDIGRVVFREAHVAPPPGFHKILEVELPAKVSIGSRVVIIPQKDRQIRDGIKTRFEVDDSVAGALERILRGPFVFGIDPSVDPLDRLATPGAGGGFADALAGAAGFIEDGQKTEAAKALRKVILPAHESFGHLRVNLDPQYMSVETELIWQTIIQCFTEPKLDRFLDYPDRYPPGWLAQFYLVEPLHELYALLNDESAWRTLEDGSGQSDAFGRLKSAVRGMQEPTAVKLLQLVQEKSNDDIPKVLKVIQKGVRENYLGLSHSLAGILRPLAMGVELDKLEDLASLGVPAVTFEMTTPAEAERWREGQKEARKAHFADPMVRAAVSTFMTLGYDDSNLRATFFSVEDSEAAMRVVPMIDEVREARRILGEKGEYPLFPMQTLGKRTAEEVKRLADGVIAGEDVRFQVDVLKEFREFYLAWHPAMVEAYNTRVSPRGS